jgi:hypothetical protein
VSAATLAAVADAAVRAEPALAPYAIPHPGPWRFSAELADPNRAFVLEVVHEGYLMHYGEPRAFRGMDADLRLLAGDALYALGLSSLAATGDLEAVAELADLISLSAQAHAEGREDLIDDLWNASATALAGHAPGAREAVAGMLDPGR